MSVTVNLSADVDKLYQSLNDAAKKHIPFATARALTAIADRVAVVEKNNIKATFPTATPFTMGSFFRLYATKANLTATVDIKDIAAKYLTPFNTGGPHDLGTKKGLLTPIGQAVNQYGNLPPNTLANLKSRRDVFIGKVRGINGVWQRVTDPNKVSLLKRNAKGRLVKERKINTSGRLKLLIRFSDPKNVTQRLNWDALAIGCIKSRWKREFDTAMKNALANQK